MNPDGVNQFVANYMKCYKITQAYDETFPDKKDDSNGTKQAFFRSKTVQRVLTREMCHAMVEQDITKDRILNEIASIAFVPLTDNMKVTQSKNKLRALELLGKNKRLFVDRVETATVKSFEEQLMEIQQRGEEAESVEFPE